MKLFNNIIFYNHYGAGDLLESKEFVKAYIERLPAEIYSYAHGKNPRMFADIPNLQAIKVEDWMPMRTDTAYVNDRNLIINTWIGRDSKYVLPGIGCTIEKLCEMHNDILFKLKVSPLEKSIIDYAPQTDWKFFRIQPVKSWLEQHPERKILISNGPVQSNQAENFDMTYAIKMLADHYRHITFIITQPIDTDAENIILSTNITNPSDGFDLNEIAYLSLSCDTFIGRNSGPHVFAQNYYNWIDPKKASLSFTYESIASHNFYTSVVQMKRYWCKKTDTNKVFEACCKVIER